MRSRMVVSKQPSQHETSSASTLGWTSTWCWRRTGPRWTMRSTFRSVAFTVLPTWRWKLKSLGFISRIWIPKSNVADAREEHNADAAVEGRHLVARGPPLHVSTFHVSSSTLNAAMYTPFCKYREGKNENASQNYCIFSFSNKFSSPNALIPSIWATWMPACTLL